MLGFFRCLLLPHVVHRKRVRKLASGAYVGVCRHCGARLKREKRDHWVRDWRKRPDQEG